MEIWSNLLLLLSLICWLVSDYMCFPLWHHLPRARPTRPWMNPTQNEKGLRPNKIPSREKTDKMLHALLIPRKNHKKHRLLGNIEFTTTVIPRVQITGQDQRYSPMDIIRKLTPRKRKRKRKFRRKLRSKRRRNFRLLGHKTKLTSGVVHSNRPGRRRARLKRLKKRKRKMNRRQKKAFQPKATVKPANDEDNIMSDGVPAPLICENHPCVNLAPCERHDRFYCLNGGVCVIVVPLHARACRCPEGLRGRRCEKIDQDYILYGNIELNPRWHKRKHI